MHALQVLKDVEIDVRLHAARALGRIGPEAREAIPPLVETLNDENSDLRAEAAEALGGIGQATEDVVLALNEALNETMGIWYPSPREQIVRALGKLGPEAMVAVPALISVLKDSPRLFERQQSAMALGRIGQPAKIAVPALAKTMRQKNTFQDLGQYSADALSRIGKAAVPYLIQALKDEISEVRFAAVGALGQIGPDARDAIQPLIEALEDKNLLYREAAEDALEKIQAKTESK